MSQNQNPSNQKSEAEWKEIDKAFADFWADIEKNHPESLDPKNDEMECA